VKTRFQSLLFINAQPVPLYSVAAADFAKSRAGQAAAAVNVSLGALGDHAGDAVRSFTGKDQYTFGDITVGGGVQVDVSVDP
jgi:hypothetical protein